LSWLQKDKTSKTFVEYNELLTVKLKMWFPVVADYGESDVVI